MITLENLIDKQRQCEKEKTYIEAKIAVINELIDEFTPIQAEEETAQAVEVTETEVSLENNNYLGGVLW